MNRCLDTTMKHIAIRPTEQSSSLHFDLANKVPVVTLGFWIVKVMSTTVGETGADYLAVNAGFGKGITSAVMTALLTDHAVALEDLHPLDLLADGRPGQRGRHADHRCPHRRSGG